MTRRLEALAGYLASRHGTLLLALCATWLLLHLAYAQTLIFHDSWKHGFPLIFGIVKQSQCGVLPSWFGMIDNGSPLIIYLVSVSLTQVVLLPFLYLMGCLHPDVIPAMYAYKLEIYLSYLIFSFGMYLLGRVLFRHALAAAYLLAATLFSGMSLDNAHSSQIVSIVFWVPWILICVVLAFRDVGSRLFLPYVNAAVLLTCAQLLDQYPHITAADIKAAIAYAADMVADEQHPPAKNPA